MCVYISKWMPGPQYQVPKLHKLNNGRSDIMWKPCCFELSCDNRAWPSYTSEPLILALAFYIYVLRNGYVSKRVSICVMQQSILFGNQDARLCYTLPQNVC